MIMGSSWPDGLGGEGEGRLPHVLPTQDHSFQVEGGPCTHSSANIKEGRRQLGE